MNTLRALLILIFLLSFSGVRARALQPSPPPAPANQAPTGAQSVAPQNPSDSAKPQQKAPPPIVSTTGLVHLVATVTDRRHNFVTDLDQKDFKIMEDTTPQEIRFFGRETD